MIDESTYNELDRYFHSQMNAGEQAAFESQLNANEELRAELVWLNAMTGGMHQQGRSVMKQTIASAIAGVPMREVSKYKPSMNRKSFLKKWWWVLAGTAVVVAVAVAAYKYVTLHHDMEGEGYDVPTEESVTISLLLNDSVVADSCLDEVIVPADSAPGNISEKVIVNQKTEEPIDPHAPVQDSPRLIWYSEAQVGIPKVATARIPMNTNIVRRTQPPYEYKLDAALTLYANYTSTAGFIFEGTGDTIYMTDNSNQKFMLLRGKGQRPLTPIRVKTKGE